MPLGAGDESVNSRFSAASRLLRPSFQMPAHLVCSTKRAAGKPGMGITWPTANSRQMPSVDFAPELFQRLPSSSKGVLPIPAVIPSYQPGIPTSCWHCPQGALGMLPQEVGIPIRITAGAPFPIMGLYSHWAFSGFGFILFQQLLPFIGTLDNYRPGRNVKTGNKTPEIGMYPKCLDPQESLWMKPICLPLRS